MPLPLLAAGLIGAGSVLSGGVSVGKAFENRKYWDEYYRNTGYRARYPYRSGYNDIYGAIGHGLGTTGALYGSMYAFANSPRPRVINSHFDYPEYRRRR